MKITAKALAKKMQARADVISNIPKTQRVSYAEIFHKDFMAKHTKFASLQEMADAAGLEENEEINSQHWSDFVAENSTFKNWQEMKEAANRQYLREKILQLPQ